jgi:hypothetical protein
MVHLRSTPSVFSYFGVEETAILNNLQPLDQLAASPTRCPTTALIPSARMLTP